MKKFFNCTLVTLCYWLVMFIGPALVLLWNNVGYYVTGAGFGTESLMYKVLTFFSQPISCFLAAAVARSISKEKFSICTLLNCVVGACYCCMSVGIYTFFVENTSMLYVMSISAISCIITAAMQVNEIKKVFCETESEAEKYKTENIKMKKIMQDHQIDGSIPPKHIILLNMVAEKTGTSIYDLANMLYMNIVKNYGEDTDAAQIKVRDTLRSYGYTDV